MGKNKVIVIGGGASGIIAAIVASRKGAKVTILERKDRIGKKILATGNGRCNISNNTVNSNNYYSEGFNPSFYDSVLNQFSVNDTLTFFKELGIEVVEKENGKLYPRSEQANSVVTVLLFELQRLKVDIICNEEVKDIELDKNIKVITNNKKYYCNKLIIATGGKSCPDLGSNGSGFLLAKNLGHSIIKPFPSLVQLKTDYSYLKHLNGTKIVGNISILDENKNILKEDYGEILFTSYGISGPPVLQVSRFGSKRYQSDLDTYVSIDIVSDYSKDEINELLLQRFINMPNKKVEDNFIGFINNKLIIPILKTSKVDINKKSGDVTKEERLRLINSLKSMSMRVIGTHQWNQSQVTAGGINTKEVNPNTLESIMTDNIYFCGEVLDVDGDCGGYNLQWAWSSGFVAGLLK